MVDYNAFNVDPLRYQQTAMNNFAQSQEFRANREDTATRNAMAERQMRNSEKYNDFNMQRQAASDQRQTSQDELKLAGIQADVIKRALSSVKDPQSWESFKGWMGTVGRSPLGQSRFFSALLNSMPQEYNQQKIQEAMANLNSVAPSEEQRPQQLSGEAGNLAVMLGRNPTTQEYLEFKKSQSSQQTQPGTLIPINTAEGVYAFNNRAGTVTPIKSDGKQLVSYTADAELAEKKAQQKAEVELQKKLKISYPKVRGALNSQNRQWDFVDKKIDQALNQVSGWTAGPGASLAKVPGTPQKDLQETLATIKANIGFDKLQNMRQNSPTGGALGQVSDMENKLLQAVQGSLDQSQSPSQLKQNLANIKSMLGQLRDETKTAFEQDYDSIISKSGQRSSGQGPNNPPVEGARKAPDGNWYVKQPNGKYARVDME